eukprot:scaffold12373_cov97-Isochrysis_galbana.AAC.3
MAALRSAEISATWAAYGLRCSADRSLSRATTASAAILTRCSHRMLSSRPYSYGSKACVVPRLNGAVDLEQRNRLRIRLGVQPLGQGGPGREELLRPEAPRRVKVDHHGGFLLHERLEGRLVSRVRRRLERRGRHVPTHAAHALLRRLAACDSRSLAPGHLCQLLCRPDSALADSSGASSAAGAFSATAACDTTASSAGGASVGFSPSAVPATARCTCGGSTVFSVLACVPAAFPAPAPAASPSPPAATPPPAPAASPAPSPPPPASVPPLATLTPIDPWPPSPPPVPDGDTGAGAGAGSCCAHRPAHACAMKIFARLQKPPDTHPPHAGGDAFVAHAVAQAESMKPGLCPHSPVPAQSEHSLLVSAGSAGSGAADTGDSPPSTGAGADGSAGSAGAAAIAKAADSSTNKGARLPGRAKRRERLAGACAGGVGLLPPLDSRMASLAPPMTFFCCSDMPAISAAARWSAEPCVCICLCHGKMCSAMSPSARPASPSWYRWGDHMPSDRPSASMRTLCRLRAPSSLCDPSRSATCSVA